MKLDAVASDERVGIALTAEDAMWLGEKLIGAARTSIFEGNDE